MRSLAAVLFLSLAAALPVSAAQADLELTVQPLFSGPRVQVDRPVSYYVVVRNLGPDVAHNVHVKATLPAHAKTGFITLSDRVEPCTNNECVVDSLPRYQAATFVVDLTFEPTPTTATTSFAATADEPDANLANNSSTQTAQIVSAPELYGTVSFYEIAEAEGTASAMAWIGNYGVEPAHNVVYDVEFPAGTTVTGAHPTDLFTCDFSGAHLTCRADVLPPRWNIIQFGIDLVAPARYEGGSLNAVVRISTSDQDLDESNNVVYSSWFFYHLFVVRSTADNGNGTLRQAIFDANATCGENCRIAFRIPENERNERGWFVIRPESPLPFVNAPVTIVAPPGAQPEGHRVNPQVMLDGSKLAYGNGLGLDTQSGNGKIGVRGLAIGNFPNAGISMIRGSHEISECFIGTLPNGLDPAPNTRGIEASGSRAISLTHNVVSGNKRSGITLGNTYRPQLTRNAIGLGANGVTPVPNGASGVYLADGADWAFFFNNDIAYNVDFGIAMAPGIKRMLASINAIYGNLQQGIDAGIDLQTPNVEDDVDRIPNHPVIDNARWDDAQQKTIIEGEMHSDTTSLTYPFFIRLKVELYADASEHPQAREFLGTASVTDGRFALAVDRDLRGKSVTGIGIRWLKVEQYDEYLLSEETSEISAPMKVE
ncbi:MAG: right-handed parallel beta-helix repeat-containing protein [Acidobacteria bacterium]|nr:right-handed parallel beta-helix repeat-containing protein [Acidobacteriota bacterium]